MGGELETQQEKVEVVRSSKGRKKIAASPSMPLAAAALPHSRSPTPKKSSDGRAFDVAVEAATLAAGEMPSSAAAATASLQDDRPPRRSLHDNQPWRRSPPLLSPPRQQPMSPRPRLLDDAEPQEVRHQLEATPFLEVTNLPELGSLESAGAAEQQLMDLFNPTLAILPEHDGARGPPIQSSWRLPNGSVLMELQSEAISASAVRVLDGLDLCGQKLRARTLAPREAAAALGSLP